MTPYYNNSGITLFSGDLLDVLPTLPENSIDFVVTDSPYGLSFMGKEWDFAVPGPEYWQAIARVCKPGALMLAFGGTRTYHRLVCAIEDAGWEIRDCLMWLHGQGFPKAPDVGKMIDKAKGAKREVIGMKSGYTMSEGKGGGCYGGGKGLHAPGTDARLRSAQITAPATPEAEKWTGWANALKPAWEPIVLAMKPLDGTLANNALTWGVAGMNIDACRIDYVSEYDKKHQADICKGTGTFFGGKGISKASTENPTGRFPANVLLDEETAKLLDTQTGTLKSGKDCIRTKSGDGYHGNMGKAGDVQVSYGDSGGASRFFYCAKASKRERGKDNKHPTVKPINLMKYLLTLLSTPDGGIILDPFAGSGSTLLAAKQLGRRCIGVELDKHNCDIIVSRLES